MNNILRINATEWVSTYPEHIPSCIGQLPARLAARDARHAARYAAAALSRSAAMEALLRRLLWGSLQAVGLCRNAAPIPLDPATGAPRLDIGLLPLYHCWLAESLAVLKEFVHCDGQYM